MYQTLSTNIVDDSIKQNKFIFSHYIDTATSNKHTDIKLIFSSDIEQVLPLLKYNYTKSMLVLIK